MLFSLLTLSVAPHAWGTPQYTPGLCPSCTKRPRADVSTAAFPHVPGLAHERGGDRYVMLISCSRQGRYSKVQPQEQQGPSPLEEKLEPTASNPSPSAPLHQTKSNSSWPCFSLFAPTLVKKVGEGMGLTLVFRHAQFANSISSPCANHQSPR